MSCKKKKAAVLCLSCTRSQGLWDVDQYWLGMGLNMCLNKENNCFNAH